MLVESGADQGESSVARNGRTCGRGMIRTSYLQILDQTTNRRYEPDHRFIFHDRFLCNIRRPPVISSSLWREIGDEYGEGSGLCLFM